MDSSKKAYGYLLLAVVVWSTNPAVAKLALAELDNFQVLFYMCIFAIISLFTVNLLQGKLGLLLEYSPGDYLKMFVLGMLGIFLYHAFLLGGFALAPAGQVNVMNYLWPVFVILFSIPLLKERLTPVTLLSVSISFIGALIAFTGGNLRFSSDYTQGYILAALGALCYGLFSVLGQKWNYENYSGMLVYSLSAAALIIPITLVFSSFTVPLVLTTWLAVAFLGGVVNSLAVVFWFKALELGDTHKMANLVYAVPFLAMIWTYLLNAELFSAGSIVGLALIVMGVLIRLRYK
ncbi:MAG: DMT family transporter [Candidatus Aenigmarchaeota archaeon]|nr:DMT family transporter [Candidatus Aenigmarchaeota archaeon]